MTASTPTLQVNPAFAPRQAVAWTFAGAVLVIGAWFWVILSIATAAIPVIVNRFAEVEMSYFSASSAAPRWFLFVLALVLVVGCIGPHVAAGRTRREFVVVLGTVMVGASLVFALLALAGFAIERWAYAAAGWTLTVQPGHIFTSTDEWGLILLENAALMPVAALAGMAVGAAYYRFGGWLGTALLPVTAGPVLVASAAVQGDWVPESFGTGALPLLAGAGAALAIAAALAVLAFAFLRHTPVRRVSLAG